MSGSYVKVPWSILEEPWVGDVRAVGRYVLGLLDEHHARRRRRRYVSRQVWLAVLTRHGHRCAYCGRSDLPLEREHRLPVVLGGKDDESNIVPACHLCNQRKGVDHPDLWPLMAEPA